VNQIDRDEMMKTVSGIGERSKAVLILELTHVGQINFYRAGNDIDVLGLAAFSQGHIMHHLLTKNQVVQTYPEDGVA
jgi:uridine phosphorylase